MPANALNPLVIFVAGTWFGAFLAWLGNRLLKRQGRPVAGSGGQASPTMTEGAAAAHAVPPTHGRCYFRVHGVWVLGQVVRFGHDDYATGKRRVIFTVSETLETDWKGTLGYRPDIGEFPLQLCVEEKDVRFSAPTIS
jgi:hypothetical protein